MVAHSYLNLYLCNGAAIVPLAGRPTDASDEEALMCCGDVSPIVRSSVYRVGHCVRRRRSALHNPAGPGQGSAAVRVITGSPGVSYARVREPESAPDPGRGGAAPLASGSRGASRRARGGRPVGRGEGARLVCLQELTLSRYFAVTPDGPRPGVRPERLGTGPPSRSQRT